MQAFDAAKKKTMLGVDDIAVRTRAIGAIEELERAIKSYGVGIRIPRIVTDFSFNEAYYELIFRHVTIGFLISKNSYDEGWFINTDDAYGDISRSYGLDSIARAASFIWLYDGYGRDSGVSREMCARHPR